MESINMHNINQIESIEEIFNGKRKNVTSIFSWGENLTRDYNAAVYAATDPGLGYGELRLSRWKNSRWSVKWYPNKGGFQIVFMDAETKEETALEKYNRIKNFLKSGSEVKKYTRKITKPLSGRTLTAPLTGIFSAITASCWERAEVSDIEGFKPVSFKSQDSCLLQGWIYQTPGKKCSRGTCFLMHGFCENSLYHIETAKKLSEKYDITVLSFDHRFHGKSSKEPHYPTFGCYEALDLQAAMDYADSAELPYPYTLHGTSLGGMAAQRAGIEDKRVSGLFLISVPAWPWDAVWANAQIATPVALLINAAYGWDVLNNGNILNFRQSESHRPLVCYIIGDKDRYGISNLKKVFKHWHNGEHGEYDKLISESSECRKFFYTVPEAVHPEGSGYCVWHWKKFDSIEKEFFETILCNKEKF